jgi:hypothetical protein
VLFSAKYLRHRSGYSSAQSICVTGASAFQNRLFASQDQVLFSAKYLRHRSRCSLAQSICVTGAGAFQSRLFASQDYVLFSAKYLRHRSCSSSAQSICVTGAGVLQRKVSASQGQVLFKAKSLRHRNRFSSLQTSLCVGSQYVVTSCPIEHAVNPRRTQPAPGSLAYNLLRKTLSSGMLIKVASSNSHTNRCCERQYCETCAPRLSVGRRFRIYSQRFCIPEANKK